MLPYNLLWVCIEHSFCGGQPKKELIAYEFPEISVSLEISVWNVNNPSLIIYE